MMIPQSRKHPPHLPSLERPAIILLITTCTKNRKRILACDEMYRLLRNAWKLHDDYPVGRYVIMPEHIHLFIGENNTSYVSLPNWVAKWKGYVTRRWHRSSDRPIWQRSFGIDSCLVRRRTNQNGFMFTGIPSDMAWWFARMIGRFRDKWLISGGDSRGVASLNAQYLETVSGVDTRPS
jgi:REP element-mobilizing transposase RayT